MTYWREEPYDVDGVLDGSWGRWAIEVTMGAVTPSAVRGLLEFTRRFRDHRPLVVCARDEVAAVRRLGLHAMPWQEFLLRGAA